MYVYGARTDRDHIEAVRFLTVESPSLMNSDGSNLTPEQRKLFKFENVFHCDTWQHNGHVEWGLQEYLQRSALPINSSAIEPKISFPVDGEPYRREAKYTRLWKRAGAGSVKSKEGTEQKPACGFVVGLSWCPVSELAGCVVDNIEKKKSS